ncbi:S24 family peptidase [Thalassobaculum sp.]|uniref:S24 family peptidase n=1 Tax=Thalassobaculum sp. TaxID=2022740 RepID=UPI003B58D29C
MTDLSPAETTRLADLREGRLLPVKGDGMEPTLSEHGFAVVAPCERIASDGVYVLLYQGDPIIRRCQLLAGKRVRLLLDSPLYAGTDNILPKADADDMVIGRVVGACNPI